MIGVLASKKNLHVQTQEKSGKQVLGGRRLPPGDEGKGHTRSDDRGFKVWKRDIELKGPLILQRDT